MITLSQIPMQAKDFFRLIPQDCVRHAIVWQEPVHNAIWDMNIRESDGRVFFSVCGEGQASVYARLYEYIPGESRFVHHFSLENESIQHDCTIRASKFHTSIHFMDDGRLIMQTHTTSPSPLHPAWMPESYHNHQWEAFRGSEIIIYDPDTHTTQYKGVLSPYSTLYGGGLSNRGRLFFGAAMYSGLGYIYDLDSNSAVCIGQVTDGNSNRFIGGPDGHIYYGTATGHLARLNVDTRRIELVAQTRENSPMRHGLFDNDGVFWFSAKTGKSLYTFNTKNGEYHEIGRFFDGCELTPGDIICYGLDFDSDGCLWFCANIIAFAEDSNNQFAAGSRLFKWDVLRGKKPVDFGYIGTVEKRNIAVCAQASIHNDILFVTDGNHLDNPVGIVEIDLSKMSDSKINNDRPLSADALVYMPIAQSRRYFPKGEQTYDLLAEEAMEFYEKEFAGKRIMNENSIYASFYGMTGVALWEYIGYGNASVRALSWEDNKTLKGVCGIGEFYSFYLRFEDNEIRMLEYKKDQAVIPDRLTVPIPEGVTLPYIPGRQYLAKAECSVRLADGSIVAGTKDMMLCRIHNGHVYGLGAVTTAGGVHCLSVAPDGKTVYGVAGYEQGNRGDIFRYNPDNGLFWLGSVPVTTTPTGRKLVCTRPWVCAVSPDGRYLAIGSLDEMSGVGVYTLEPNKKEAVL